VLHNGEIPDDLFVCHTCDNPMCVNPDHLFLGTNSDNVKDMVDKNRQAKGEGKSNAKLTKADVDEIREHWGEFTQREISKYYKVTQSVISEVINYKTWVG
jgi:predicted XRE-type DNA-binding protein